MAQKVTQYDLLISCPGDIIEELKIIENVVDKFNQLFTDVLGISIRTKHWVKSGYAQSGDKPQNLINKQFALGCDAAVAIFWTRFGTPTDKFGSGTEEEIENMLAMDKQVFMYFSEKNISPSKFDSKGYKRVQDFKERYTNRGIYYTYDTNEKFEKLFFAHLSLYFLGKKRLIEANSQNSSSLILKGINNLGRISENMSVQKFYFQTNLNKAFYISKIKNLYKEIVSKKVSSPTPKVVKHIADYFPAVEIEENKCKIIEEVLNTLELPIPQDLFCLGNLSRDIYSTSLVNYQPHYRGTDDEKAKYELLNELYEIVVAAKSWIEYEQAFSEKFACKLALQNDGTNFDEDIEITLKFPKNTVLTHLEFPKFSNETMEIVLNEYGLTKLFGIPATAEYQDYISSIRKTYSSNFHPEINNPFSESDYTEYYEETLSDVFCYEVYLQDDFLILKLHIDYLKHHTSVAFPSVIFLKTIIDEVEYTISSKNNPDIIQGKLKIIADIIN